MIFTVFAIYLVIWWLVLFVTLPFGVRGQAEDDSVVDGTEPGAPVFDGMWRKAAITSVIAAVLTALFFAAWLGEWIDWRKWPWLPDRPEGY